MGVAFKWGRVATAMGVLVRGQLMLAFHCHSARVRQVTCLIYLVGMVAICFAPDTSGKRVEEE
jgi:hypothetical protein